MSEGVRGSAYSGVGTSVICKIPMVRAVPQTAVPCLIAAAAVEPLSFAGLWCGIWCTELFEGVEAKK